MGGGQGRLIAAILRANPGLRGTLLDLPSVVEGAPQRCSPRPGWRTRCEVVGGDMFEAVPGAGDLYILSRVVHDWEDARAVDVLQICRRAMHAEPRASRSGRAGAAGQGRARACGPAGCAERPQHDGADRRVRAHPGRFRGAARRRRDCGCRASSRRPRGLSSAVEAVRA